jgi:hypothetical protein
MNGDVPAEVEDGRGCLSYKKLYHAAVERGYELQKQLERCSGLLSKHHKIAELKVGLGTRIVVSGSRGWLVANYRCVQQLPEGILRPKVTPLHVVSLSGTLGSNSVWYHKE